MKNLNNKNVKHQTEVKLHIFLSLSVPTASKHKAKEVATDRETEQERELP